MNKKQIFKNSRLFILISLISPNLFASALVHKDDANQTLEVIAQMNYSGDLENGLELSNASTQEIARMWNESEATTQIDQKTYQIKFTIGQTYNEPKLIYRKKSCAHNFISIKKNSTPGERSYYRALYSNTGVFYTDDDLGKSSTAAHEFGHGLGLKHDELDQTSTQAPGIMFARGTLVKAQFQWDPDAFARAPGGTISPYHRRVRAQDVAHLELEKLSFNDKGFACVGVGHAVALRLNNTTTGELTEPIIAEATEKTLAKCTVATEISANSNKQINAQTLAYMNQSLKQSLEEKGYKVDETAKRKIEVSFNLEKKFLTESSIIKVKINDETGTEIDNISANTKILSIGRKDHKSINKLMVLISKKVKQCE
ncbi:MAG: hypothetical protein ACOYL6_15375 [Bacteriovoracaceae bacterium]